MTWQIPFEFDDRFPLQAVNEREYWDALTAYSWLTDEFIPKVLNYTRHEKGLYNINFRIHDQLYESAMKKEMTPDQVHTQKQLNSFVHSLQSFYYSDNKFLLTSAEIRALYSAVRLCLSKDKGPYCSHYILSRLQIPHLSESSYLIPEIIEEIDRYITSLEDGVYSSWQVENVMRCIIEQTKDEEIVFTPSEIRQILQDLRPFYEKKVFLQSIKQFQ